MNVKGVKQWGIPSYSTAPDLVACTKRGVSNFTTQNELKTENLVVSSSGVGNITIQKLNCNNLVLNNSSVGNVTINGTARTAVLNSEGVGNIKAEGLKVENLEVKCSGVGNITCYATESLRANASGVGSIRYKGSPQVKDFRKSGVGSIKSM